MTQELIKIRKENGNQAVDGRELHAFLEVKTRFNDWIVRKIEKYDLIEGEDYSSISRILETDDDSPSQKREGDTQKRVSDTQNRVQTEYILTIDCAKELCMVENNEKGKQARRYFIEVEKQFREIKNIISIKPKDPFEKLMNIIIDINDPDERKKLLAVALEIKSEGIRTYLRKEDYDNTYLRWEASRIRKKKEFNRTNTELDILNEAEKLGL